MSKRDKFTKAGCDHSYKRIFISNSAEETQKIGYETGKKVASGLMCLFGPLGAGKTTFIRGLAEGLGITSRISSPTFTYQRIHKGRLTLYHFDCYRISNPDELITIELHEALSRPKSIVAVEWAENIEKFLPKKRTDIYFKYKKEDIREIIFLDHD